MTCRKCKMRWAFTQQCVKTVSEAGAEREGWMKAVVTCSRGRTEINYQPKLFLAEVSGGL